MPAAWLNYVVLDPQAPRRAVEPQVAAIAKALAEAARARTPRESGELAAGWRAVKAPGPPAAVWFVENPVPYAAYVEYGTAHTRPVVMLGVPVAQVRRQTKRRRRG